MDCSDQLTARQVDMTDEAMKMLRIVDEMMKGVMGEVCDV